MEDFFILNGVRYDVVSIIPKQIGRYDGLIITLPGEQGVAWVPTLYAGEPHLLEFFETTGQRHMVRLRLLEIGPQNGNTVLKWGIT